MRSVLLIFILCSFTCLAFAAEEPAKFTLNTSAFLNQGALPVLYTCDGKNVSPQLSWSNPPAKTKSFTLIFSDPDAPNGKFYHWILYNIPVNVTTLPERTTTPPPGAILGKNSWGKAEYSGPCPPHGSAHTYIFTLYALDAPLQLSATDGPAVIAAMQKHIISQVDLVAVYSRWLK